MTENNTDPTTLATDPESIDDLFNALHGLACLAAEGDAVATHTMTALDVLIGVLDQRIRTIEDRLDGLEQETDSIDSQLHNHRADPDAHACHTLAFSLSQSQSRIADLEARLEETESRMWGSD